MSPGGPGAEVSGDACPTDAVSPSPSSTTDSSRIWTWHRSRAQLAGLDWAGDPSPVLGHLVVFGPSPADITE